MTHSHGTVGLFHPSDLTSRHGPHLLHPLSNFDALQRNGLLRAVDVTLKGQRELLPVLASP